MDMKNDIRKLRQIILIVVGACICLKGTAKNSHFVWYNGKNQITYYLSKKVDPVVEIALEMLNDDLKQVTGQIICPASCSAATIRIVQLDKENEIIDKLLLDNKVPIDSLKQKKEAFYIKVIKGSQLLVVGSDRRGTAYGILELSRLAGVSPWIWWSDVIPECKNSLMIESDFETFQSPSVEYRGIFLNDEDWTLQPWSWRHYDPQKQKGMISAKTYKQLFKLLLRLRANTIWPGMHGMTTPFYMVPGAKEAADSCGIVVGTSHCEPMMRNNVGEWDKEERGDYNYLTNKKTVHSYWIDRLKEVASYENIYTLGMRGIHDSGMEGVKGEQEKTEWLQTVIEEQRKLLKKYVNKDVEKIPQQFIPYKEVLAIFENGLNIPDDVILTWCDDNYGYMTRLPDSLQQKRKGGSGIYHHLSYWGVPHDYMWLCGTQPGLIYNEMREAYHHNVRRLWVTNIHEPKVAAYNLELFLDMAWNINALSPSTLNRHLEQWLCREFGKEAGKRLVPVMQTYYKLVGIRRPEFMGWTVLSGKTPYGRDNLPVKNTEFNSNEIDYYLNCWQQAREQLMEAEKLIPERLKDAFFSHVKYQVLAAAAMSEKLLEAQRANQIARRNYDASRWTRDSVLYTACAKSQAAYLEIRSLTDYWNNKMAGGKWKYTMCDIPRDLRVFYAPLLPVIFKDAEITKYIKARKNNENLKDDDNTFVARNAVQYDKADTGIEIVQMLGHSMQAVALPKGKSLTYRFTTELSDSCMLRIAVIPTHPAIKGDIRYSVSVDGGKPQVLSFRVDYRSQEWNDNVQRGQSIKTIPLKLSANSHTLTIRALDDHVVVDQWMIDFKPERQFYMFPVSN